MPFLKHGREVFGLLTSLPFLLAMVTLLMVIALLVGS